MSAIDLIALSPLLILGLSTVLLMLVVAFFRRHGVALGFSLLGLGIAFLSLVLANDTLPRQVTSLFTVDGYSYYFMGLLFAAGAAVAVFSYGLLQGFESGNREEFYILLLLASLGASTLVLSSHFASLFLGLEILSVSLYAMIAYMRDDPLRLEASVKYLILAGATSAALVFGMALIYAQFGSMAFDELSRAALDLPSIALLPLIGTALVIVGVGFKLALVPFHMWTPDVYQGAPAPVTAFVATVSKAAMFALALRYFSGTDLQSGGPIWAVFGAIAVASMLVGNVLAVIQDNLKRILAYSSISHLGYIMVAFLASGAFAQPAVAFYLVTYSITTLVAFGVIAMLSEAHAEVEALSHYRGLFWRRPGLALALSAALLSLAGLPPMAGLVGKIYLAIAGVGSSLWVLLGALVVGSVIGVYYYVRVLVMLYRQPEEGVDGPEIPIATLGSKIALAVLSALLVLFGLYPVPLMRLIEALVRL
jgi:NADH-quinone oxidoreductase subunit N